MEMHQPNIWDELECLQVLKALKALEVHVFF